MEELPVQVFKIVLKSKFGENLNGKNTRIVLDLEKRN